MPWIGSENPNLHENIKKSSSFGTVASCILHSHVRVNSRCRDRTVYFYKKDIEESEDTKGAIRIRISKKNRQHNGQNKKDKKRSTEHTYKTKDRVTRTPLKTGGELRCFGRVGSSYKLTHLVLKAWEEFIFK